MSRTCRKFVKSRKTRINSRKNRRCQWKSIANRYTPVTTPIARVQFFARSHNFSSLYDRPYRTRHIHTCIYEHIYIFFNRKLLFPYRPVSRFFERIDTFPRHVGILRRLTLSRRRDGALCNSRGRLTTRTKRPFHPSLSAA